MPRQLSTSSLFGGLVLALCLVPLVPACGGRSNTEDYLFGQNPTAGTGANGTGASSNTGARPGDDPGDDDPGTGATGSGATGTGGTGIVSEGGESSIDPGGTSNGGNATGGTGVAGSAGAPSGPRISCGATTCDTSTQICCAGLGGFGCLAKNKECNGAVLACSMSDDCAGNNVCCLRVVGDANAGSVCKAGCAGMGPGRERQLCRADDECPSGHCRDTAFGVQVCTRR